MSKKLQKQYKLFKGDKVIYNTGDYLIQRVVEDVTEISTRDGDSFVGVILEGSDGCYVNYSDIITLQKALIYFDLKLIELEEIHINDMVDMVGIVVKR